MAARGRFLFWTTKFSTFESINLARGRHVLVLVLPLCSSCSRSLVALRGQVMNPGWPRRMRAERIQEEVATLTGQAAAKAKL